MKKLVYLIIIIVFIVNFPLINKFILLELDQGTFKYSNNDASYTDTQYFGFKDSSVSKADFYWFIKETNPEVINQEPYRLYKINPLCFWRWNYYILTSSKFKYKSWSDIEPNRVSYNPKNRWQAF